MSVEWLLEASEGVLLRLQIQPGASNTAIVGVHGEPPRLKIRVAAPPVEGAANEALLHFLKKKLAISASRMTIVRGHSSKMKDILCTGVSADEAERALGRN